jgi:hypothetical protein
MRLRPRRRPPAGEVATPVPLSDPLTASERGDRDLSEGPALDRSYTHARTFTQSSGNDREASPGVWTPLAPGNMTEQSEEPIERLQYRAWLLSRYDLGLDLTDEERSEIGVPSRRLSDLREGVASWSTQEPRDPELQARRARLRQELAHLDATENPRLPAPRR